MHYVKQFHINGVDTKQVACIELHGKPNAATEGCVGVLGIDVDSPLHDVYKCAAVNGSIYTWELLSSGLSIIVTDVVGSGAETVEFPYDTLKTPSLYVVKIGDSILDGEGYLYQVATIGASSCVATYCGIHVVKFGMSAYGLAVEQGFEGTLEEWLASLEASVYVRYSAYEDGTDFTVEWSRGQRYIGVCCGHTPPVEKTDFVWSRFDAGVYIGSGDMPEWCDLQIDPDGDVTEIVQESGQSTTNVMSQKAVSNTFSNALTGSASGEIVALNDVSPIAHEMAASVRKKNLCPVASITTDESAAGLIMIQNLTKHGTYTASADITLFEDDGANNPSLQLTVFYTDGTHTTNYYGTGLLKDGVAKRVSTTITTDTTKTISYFRILALNYTTNNGRHAKAENIQLEEGATATAYAPYIDDVGGVNVLAYGKNLLDIHNRTKGTMKNGANTMQRVFETDKYYVGLTANNYCYDYQLTTAEYVDGVWRIANKGAGYGIGFPVAVKPNTNYYLTGTNGYITVGFYDQDGNYIYYFQYTDDGKAYFTTPSNCAIATICLVPKDMNTVVEFSNCQLELGTTATEYEPYKEPVTYAANEAITSIYPSMTLTTDTAGAIMDVTYNRDANKVLQEILSRLTAVETAVLN